MKGQAREKAPKTARSARTLVLAPFVVAALRSQKALQGKERLGLGIGRVSDGDYVFDRNDRRGEPWNPDTFGSRFYSLVRWKKRLKTPKLTAGTKRRSSPIGLGRDSG